MSSQPGFNLKMADGNDDAYSIRKMDKSIIKMFLKYLKPQKSTLLLAFIAVIFVAATNIAGPYLSRIAIDDYIANKNFAGLTSILLIYIVIYAVFWLTSFWSSYLSRKIGQRVVANIRKDLFSNVVSQSMDFFNKNKTGEIMSRLTNDVDTLAEFVSSGVVNFASDLLTLLLIVVVMFSMNVKLAAIVLVVIPIMFFGTNILGSHMRKAYSSVRTKVAKLNAGVEENLSGIKVVKSMSQQKENVSSFEKLNKENMNANKKAVLISAIFFPFMTISGTLSIALILVVGGSMVSNGLATIGLIVAFIGFTNKFFIPLRDLSQMYKIYQGAAASGERIFEYLNIQPDIQSPEHSKPLPQKVTGRIDFNDVKFQYVFNQPLINSLNLFIPAGQSTAIVGPTGAGKSTLIKLLARLYDVTSGSVSIDGVDVRDIKISELRETVMVVPQEVFLFVGTIMENIRFGKLDATDEEVILAAKSACADNFIEGLPNRYDTQVGKGGSLLSGGQRQLIAFARAILADKPILILDEATSSVDAMSESLIQQALKNLLKGRTSIIIAHRFTTLKMTSKIAVMNDGNIIGYSDHADLLKTCAVYKELYEKQWVG